MNIVCLGDSITHSAGYAECDRWPTILQFKLKAKHGDKFKVYNQGAGGQTVSQGFDRLGTDVLPLLPAIVLLQFGFNDVFTYPFARVPRVGLKEFADKLRELDRIFKARQSTSVFIASHSICEARTAKIHGTRYCRDFLRYNQAVRQVARALRAPLIDLPALMRKRKVDVAAFTGVDGLHLSVEGSHLYAEMVLDGLAPVLVGC